MKLLQKAKKSLGQNFLIDKNIITKIVQIGNINSNKNVLEIGSGYGSLTESILLLKPKRIFAVEKDKFLSSFLANKFKKNKNINIINKDILNLIHENSFGRDAIVFGNLPYSSSTKILSELILLNNWPPWYEILILMFQKEVADRILAKVNTKEFSRLTVLANWRLEIKKHFNVSNNCFFPKPAITSTILSFKPKKTNKFNLKNPKNLEKVTRILFSNRRKMINKNFIRLFKKNERIAKKLNIDLTKRADQLSNEMFYKIAVEYDQLFN